MENSYEARLHSIEVVQVSDTTFALECNSKLYYIGAILFRIVQYLKAGKAFPEIQALVADEYKMTLSREKFDHILDDTLSKIITAATADALPQQAYVYGQVPLLGERTLVFLTRQLDFLFRQSVGMAMLVLSLVATGLFLFRLYQAHLLQAPISAKEGIAMAVGGYVFFAVVGLFHELGHATAAARHKISPKEIGFGFYLVLPVLYTDVSRIWILTKAKRIMVNLAGIYFQGLVNILLFVAYEVTARIGGPTQYVIVSFFLTNATLALYSLNPFFRNDGYWIFSDLFAIPNLSAAARGYLHKCWSYLRSRGQAPFRGVGLTLTSEIALLVYAVGRITMISWFSYLGYSGFYHSFQETVQRINHEGQFAHETLFESTFYLLRVALFCGLFVVLAYRTLKPLAQRAATRLGWLAAEQPQVALPA